MQNYGIFPNWRKPATLEKALPAKSNYLCNGFFPNRQQLTTTFIHKKKNGKDEYPCRLYNKTIYTLNSANQDTNPEG
jgi:hypothetical protein